MAYEFKNLNEIPTQDAPTENTTVMAFESGNPRQIPASELGGKGFVFELTPDDYTVNDGQMEVTKNYDPLYDVLMSGGSAAILFPKTDDMPAHYESVEMCFIEENVGLLLETWNFSILFTNGSYHTTA